MRNFKSKLVLSLLGAGLIFTSCNNEDSTELIDEQQAGISQEVLDQLSSFAVNTDGIVRAEQEHPDGTKVNGYMLEGDIFMSEDHVASLTSVFENDITSEQYRTNNLVSSPRTLSVIGYTGGGNALTNNMRTGLQYAINNYNRLNVGLRFTLRFATSTNADIVVYRQPNNSGAGGSAGFPSGGNPNKFVQIFRGLDNSNPNVNEHVATHEIGHSIGFRHTDYFSRQSCGQNTNEGTAGVGAVHIPGTPTGYDSTSIMLACFSFNTNGEFNNNDITAMNFLY